MKFLGGSAVGFADVVETVFATEDVKSGDFLCIDKDTGKYRKVASASDKVTHFVIAPGVGLGGNQATLIEGKTSSNIAYNKYEIKAGFGVPAIRRGIERYVELGEAVEINDPVYLDPTTNLVCKTASASNIRIGNSVFAIAGEKGDVVAISFDLL